MGRWYVNPTEIPQLSFFISCRTGFREKSTRVIDRSGSLLILILFMASSRIFIKGLPPTISEEEFKKHFSKDFAITDAKLISNRRIGYVGYKTPEDAAKAVKYFNRTFIRMSKIGVEIARPVSYSLYLCLPLVANLSTRYLIPLSHPPEKPSENWSERMRRPERRSGRRQQLLLLSMRAQREREMS